MRKAFLGLRESLNSECSKLFCLDCLHSSYSHILNKPGNGKTIICPVCSVYSSLQQDDCHCRRCHRRDNIVKYGRVFEKLGGDTEKLVQDSPISTLCSRVLAMASPKINKDHDVQYKKPSGHSHKASRRSKSHDQFTDEEVDFLKACLTSRHTEILYDLTKLVKVCSPSPETRNYQAESAAKLDRGVHTIHRGSGASARRHLKLGQEATTSLLTTTFLLILTNSALQCHPN